MQNKYNELVKIIKNNNIRLEKDEFKIVNEIINMKDSGDEYYNKYFKLSDKAKAIAQVFTFGDIDPNELTEKCYVLYIYELDKYCNNTRRAIRIAQNKSQLLHIFLNKTKSSNIIVRIKKYGLDEFVL